MKKNTTTVISIILVIALILSSCGDKNKKKPSSSSSSSSSNSSSSSSSSSDSSSTDSSSDNTSSEEYIDTDGGSSWNFEERQSLLSTINREEISTLTYGTTFEAPSFKGDAKDGWFSKYGAIKVSKGAYSTGSTSLEVVGTVKQGEINDVYRSFEGYNKGVIWSEFYIRPMKSDFGVDTIVSLGNNADTLASKVVFNSADKTIVAETGSGRKSTKLSYLVQFYKITVKMDFTKRVYDLYINGNMVLSALPFYNKNTDNLGYFSLSINGTKQSASTVSAFIDDFYAGYIPPLKKLLKTMNLSDKTFGNYSSWWFTFGDIDKDNRKEMIMAQNEHIESTNYSLASITSQRITCITAIDLERGEVIWQKGKPSPDNFEVGSDVPLQLYDIDKDGSLEIIDVSWIDPAKPKQLEIRDAATGTIEKAIDLDNGIFRDSIIISNLSGDGKEFLLKDRYCNVRAYNSELELLWQYPKNYMNIVDSTGWASPLTTGHFPASKDLNGDGIDEVMIGYELLDAKGNVIWSRKDLNDCKADEGTATIEDTVYGHADANIIADLDGDGKFEAIMAGGDSGLHVVDAHTGKTRFNTPTSEFGHTQSISIADFDINIEGLEIYVLQGEKHILVDKDGNIYRNTEVHSNAHLLYVRGYNGQYFITGGRSFPNINFSVNDYKGNRIVSFDNLDSCPREQMHIANVLGDSTEEVVLMDSKRIYVYSLDMMNDRSYTDEREYKNRSLYSGEEVASSRKVGIQNISNGTSSIKLTKDTRIAQIFTAKNSNTDMISVNVKKSAGLLNNFGVTVAIHELNDKNEILSRPLSKGVLDTTNMKSDDFGWIHATFPNAVIEEDTKYAIVFTWSSSSDGFIEFRTNKAYSGGSISQFSNGKFKTQDSDLLFKTYNISREASK